MMDPVVQYFIESGITKDTIILLLMLPIVATFVVISRHILGIKSFGMYVPIIATYAWATLGFKVGFTLTIYLAFIGILTRYLVGVLRIHYLSRLSLVIGITTIAALVYFYVLTLFDTTTVYAQQSALPIVLVVLFCETFVSTQIQKGFRTSTYLFVETIIIALLGYTLITWDSMRNLLMNFPYIIIVTILVNFLIGKWNGLRLSELWRFRTIKKRS